MAYELSSTELTGKTSSRLTRYVIERILFREVDFSKITEYLKELGLYDKI